MAPSATIDELPAVTADKTSKKDTAMTPLRAISHGDELPGTLLFIFLSFLFSALSPTFFGVV